jgi:hypothetical protein
MKKILLLIFLMLFSILIFGQSVNPIYGIAKSNTVTNNPISYIVDGNSSTSIEIPANLQYFYFSIFLLNSARVKDIYIQGSNINLIQSVDIDCYSFDCYDGESDDLSTYSGTGSSSVFAINNIDNLLNSFRIDIYITKPVGTVVSISEINMDGIVDEIDASSGNDLNLRTNLFPRITIKSGTGNVGIGTTTPLNKLHISEASQTEYYGTNNGSPISNLVLQGTASTRTVGQGPSLTFAFPANTDGSNTWAQARILATPDNAGNTNASGRLYLQVRDLYDPGVGGSWNWRTGLMIAANGNVGIGTTNPGSYKLNVWGKVRANEVTVNTTGADFVFEKSYKLRPLSEVETFINTNKHLPDIAPATEMQSNGVSMGEMQTKLLQKLEETTLYLIEQQKTIDLLLKQVDGLKKENEKLDKELKELKK